MAQTFTSTEVVSTTNVFGDNQSQRVNENTLRSNFSGSSQPSDPVVGQHWYDTGNNREMTYNGTSWVAVDTNTATQVDVKNSAGNLSNLKSFLSVAHNDDGTLKVTPTSSIDEFKENSIVVTYVNPTTFTAPNDLTGIFTQYRKVKVYLSASTAISSVSSSSYNGTSNVTTVVLSASAMDATLVSIRYSIVQYGTPDGGTFSGDVYTAGKMQADGGFYGNLHGTADTANGINIVAGNEIKLRGSGSYPDGAICFGYDAPAKVVEYKFYDGTRTGSYANLVANEFHGHLVGTADNATNATMVGNKSISEIFSTHNIGTNNVNWNSITEPGCYRIGQSPEFTATLGQPVGAYTYGMLSVESYGVSTVQRYIPDHGRVVYVRSGWNGLDASSTWYTVTMADASGNVQLSSGSTLGGYTAAQLIGEVSHATNGYHKFPGGTIVQWGTGSTTSNWNTKTSFPVAFPSAVSSIVITPKRPNGTSSSDPYAETVGVKAYDLAGFYGGLVSTTGTNNFFWLAIGY